jgi:plastocyanin
MRLLVVPRSLAALLFLLSVLFTCGMSAAAQRLGADDAAPVVLEGTLSEYFVYLPQQSAPAGTVRFVVQNIGERRHNLRVVGNGVDKATPDLRPGQTGEIEVFFTDPGPYTLYCDLADHADRGMTTSFVAEDPFTQP